ncbi:hypothetical protein GmHk_06G015520 [Glycine max]|nr:hypothetical protein GYH30_014548 [Glycine max]KAH1245108.1 hypothetical protein GmHk_06G015520 [Glycine max]
MLSPKTERTCLKCGFFHCPNTDVPSNTLEYVLKLFPLLEMVLVELDGVDDFMLGRADLNLFMLTNLAENLLDGDLNWSVGFVCKPQRDWEEESFPDL